MVTEPRTGSTGPHATSMARPAEPSGSSWFPDPTETPESRGTPRNPTQSDAADPTSHPVSLKAPIKTYPSNCGTGRPPLVERALRMVRPLHRPRASAHEA